MNLRSTTLLVLPLLAVLAAPLPAGAADDLPLRLMANAGYPDTGETTLFDIVITDWTPTEDRQELVALLQSEGSRSLAGALQELSPKGRIGARGQLGIELRYAYRVEDGDRTRIVLVADRPVDVQEAIARSLVSQAYNATVLVLELDESGRGVGELMLGAEAGFDEGGELEFTNIVPNPVRLGNVRLTGAR